MDKLEIVSRQNTVIRLQSEVIDELFILLMEHITAEEADKLEVVDKINLAAQIRGTIKEE